MKAGELYGYHSGAPSEASYTAGLAELRASADTLCLRACASGRSAPRRARATRGASRGRPTAWSPPTIARWSARRSSIRACSCSTPISSRTAGWCRSPSATRIASSSAASPSRTWCRWLPAWRAAARCRSCTPSRASSPPGRTSRSTTSAAKRRRSSTSGRWPGSCRADRATRTSRSATSRRWRAIPNLVLAEPSSEAEVEAIYDHLVNRVSESSYLRLVSVKWPLPFCLSAGARPVEVGRGWIVRDGS